MNNNNNNDSNNGGVGSGDGGGDGVVAATTAMPKATMGWLRRMDLIGTLTTTCVTLTAIY